MEIHPIHLPVLVPAWIVLSSAITKMGFAVVHPEIKLDQNFKICHRVHQNSFTHAIKRIQKAPANRGAYEMIIKAIMHKNAYLYSLRCICE